jgi:hypothetical protein
VFDGGSTDAYSRFGIARGVGSAAEDALLSPGGILGGLVELGLERGLRAPSYPLDRMEP